MARSRQRPQSVVHPFGDLVGLRVAAARRGASECSLRADPRLFNPNGVLHGGAIYALADTGMAAALYTTLGPDETCATVEMKVVYLRPVTAGTLRCRSRILRRGAATAVLEATVRNGRRVVAKGLGTFAILPARRRRRGERR